MTFQGLEFTGKRPFKDCLIHGLIRDKEGRKMSKSLGNGVDPMDVIEKYGCDSLRFFLSTSTSAGMDLRYDEEKVKSTWNFVNKLWNASRFVLLNLEAFDKNMYTLNNLSLSDKWILTKMNNLIENVRIHMDKYEFNVVGTELYSFIWNDFCDQYIELAKSQMNETTKSVLSLVLTNILKMLHPFMPYVTDEIYNMLPIKDESIVISSYPKCDSNYIFEEDAKTLEGIIEFVVSVRTYKLEHSISKNTKVYVKGPELITRMLKIDKENILDSIPDTESKVQNNLYAIYFDFDNSKNIEKEKETLNREKTRLENSITRRRNLLANENYVSKAPENLVMNERETLKKEEAELQIILERLK